VLLLCATPALADPIDSAGDIVIIGLDTDSDDVAWLPLINLDAGAKLFFSDAGTFNGSFGGNQSGDGAVVFTVPTGGIAAGTLMIFNDDLTTAGYAADNSGSVGTGMDLSVLGDQIVAYVGSNPGTSSGATPIFAVNAASSIFGTPPLTPAASTTEIYPGLTDGTNAVSVGAGTGPSDEYDNVAYTGPGLSGDLATILALVTNDSNWTGSNETFDFSSFFANLTIDVQTSSGQNGGTGGDGSGTGTAPEPSALALFAAALATGLWRRRRS
jgi:hypothetical protein